MEIFPRDEYEELFSESEREVYRLRRSKKHVRGQTFYTHKAGPIAKYAQGVETKYLPLKAGIASDLIIYGNKVAMAVFRGKPMGIIIESKEIAETLRALFSLAWK